ncbi:MAG TPA: hypothetical protein VGK78_08810 [Nocardioides sp.]|uniref:hypothetical protein n=1 Tax=Nocardioides sp. TaxID=35761 RepID=UPI002F414329
MRVRRLDVLDEYVEDGRAAVYTTKGMVALLSELATAAWCMLDDRWVPTTEVTEMLIREFGDPGGGEADRLTQNALRSLAELSLVELDD